VDIKGAMGAAASAGIKAGIDEMKEPELAKLLSSLPADSRAKLASALAPQRQAAFVFIKPHANLPKVQELVKAKFAEAGITIESEGEIDGPTIDENKFIDQHYYAIASKATMKKPAELNVPKDKFSEFFKEDWDTVVKEERAFNALDAKAPLGLSDEELLKLWDATNESAGTRKKFGGGFYCGMILEKDGKKYYTFNAFFMQMRSKFVEKGKSIHYYSVNWDPAVLAWKDFRGAVLGPTDPASAPVGALRRTLYDTWEALGLAAAPNTGDNGVHASASPFEGFAERTNWLKTTCTTDVFGKDLVAAGIPEAVLKEWSVDPQVDVGDGKKASLFDQLEDLDLGACKEKLVELYKLKSA